MMKQDMYQYIEVFAAEREMNQTLAALPYAKEKHEGQFRKGTEPVPYIGHPLAAARQAIALWGEGDTVGEIGDLDDLAAAALLHDVCEDCGVALEELPVSARAREAVGLLTKEAGVDYRRPENKARYFEAIAENEIAALVKILDRCHNVSEMAKGFSKEKMVSYIRETEEYVYPLMERVCEQWPKHREQVYLLSYQIRSVMESIKVLLCSIIL